MHKEWHYPHISGANKSLPLFHVLLLFRLRLVHYTVGVQILMNILDNYYDKNNYSP